MTLFLTNSLFLPIPCENREWLHFLFSSGPRYLRSFITLGRTFRAIRGVRRSRTARGYLEACRGCARGIEEMFFETLELSNSREMPLTAAHGVDRISQLSARTHPYLYFCHGIPSRRVRLRTAALGPRCCRQERGVVPRHDIRRNKSRIPIFRRRPLRAGVGYSMLG